MNPFVQELARGELEPLDHHNSKLVVEDNVGESIHIHIRDFRLEMSIDDYVTLAEKLEQAEEEMDNGDS